VKSARDRGRLNDSARATIRHMIFGVFSGLAFAAAIIVLILKTPTGPAMLGVVIGIAVSVAFVAILLVTVLRRVRTARDTRLATLNRRFPGALVVHTEWNAALQSAFVRQDALPAEVDGRGYDVEISADLDGIRFWLGTSQLPLIGELGWRQVAQIEPTEVRAAIGSHRVAALLIRVTESSTFLPNIELIYRGEDVRALCDQLNALRDTSHPTEHTDHAPEPRDMPIIRADLSPLRPDKGWNE